MGRRSEQQPKLKIPYCPSTDDKGKYELNTMLMKLVSDYTRLNFIEVNELVYDEYLFMAREAVIYNCSQTEQGMEYLEKCWILEQTKPDRKALRNRFGK